MKRCLPLVLLSYILLTSCSLNSPPSSKEQSQAVAKQRPILQETAQKTCGDSLPESSTAYPVTFYPVVVDYSEKNLELLKSHFCKDSLKRFSKEMRKNIIQVASFNSQDKADQFKNKLKLHFDGVYVTAPTIIKSSPESASDQNTGTISPSTLEKFPSLDKNQINALLRINSRTAIGSDGRSMKFRVALPTYIPDGFKVIHFQDYDKGEAVYKIRNNATRYQIYWRNKSNICFFFSVGHGQWGDGPTGLSSVRVTSPAFGETSVERSDFDKKKPVFSQWRKDVKDPVLTTYSMHSFEDNPRHSSNLESLVGCKGELPFNEAVKIIRSMRYID